MTRKHNFFYKNILLIVHKTRYNKRGWEVHWHQSRVQNRSIDIQLSQTKSDKEEPWEAPEACDHEEATKTIHSQETPISHPNMKYPSMPFQPHHPQCCQKQRISTKSLSLPLPKPQILIAKTEEGNPNLTLNAKQFAWKVPSKFTMQEETSPHFSIFYNT